MGVSVYAYQGIQLEEAGGLPGSIASEVTHVYLDPEAGRLRANDLEKGIYAILGTYEERIGSYGYFDAFRQSLAELVGIQHPMPEGRWDEAPFGELLYASDNSVLMGAEMLEAFHRNLERYSDEASQKLSSEHLETYLVLRKAAEFARTDTIGDGSSGALSIH